MEAGGGENNFMQISCPFWQQPRRSTAAIEMVVYEGEKVVQGYVVDQEMQEAVVVPQAAASAAAEQSEPVTSRSCQAALLLAV